MKERKIKILHAIRQGKIGGGESHVIDLVGNLDNRLYESIVLAFTDGPMVTHMKSRGIKTHIIPTERPFDISKWRKVGQLLDREQIDIVHAHGTRANSNVFFSARRRKIPVIYTVHGWSFHPDQQPLLRWLRVSGERFLVNRSNLTICVSDNNYNDASKLFVIPSAKVVKYGINLRRFNPSEMQLNNVRRELNIADHTVVVGYIVRMTIQKDPLTLVKAIAMIPDELDMKFLFIGDGDLKRSAIELAAKLGVSHRIIFEGFRTDVPNILRVIDIYCLPSLWEGLPIGMLEAMAMGNPIVTTSVDGAKEVIRNGSNGFLVPPKSPEHLAEALITLGKNSTLRAQMGNNALRTVVDEFNVERMTREIESVYNDFAKHSRLN